MKQLIDLNEFEPPEYVIEFILNWKKKKHYSESFNLTLGETIELLMAVTYTFYRDDSDGRFFNNSLQNNESAIEWDGNKQEGYELIDILYYEAIQLIKKRIARAGTFNDPIDKSEKTMQD